MAISPAITCMFHELFEPLSLWLADCEKKAIESGIDEKEAKDARFEAYRIHSATLCMLIQIGVIKELPLTPPPPEGKDFDNLMLALTLEMEAKERGNATQGA